MNVEEIRQSLQSDKITIRKKGRTSFEEELYRNPIKLSSSLTKGLIGAVMSYELKEIENFYSKDKPPPKDISSFFRKVIRFCIRYGKCESKIMMEVIDHIISILYDKQLYVDYKVLHKGLCSELLDPKIIHEVPFENESNQSGGLKNLFIYLKETMVDKTSTTDTENLKLLRQLCYCMYGSFGESNASRIILPLLNWFNKLLKQTHDMNDLNNTSTLAVLSTLADCYSCFLHYHHINVINIVLNKCTGIVQLIIRYLFQAQTAKLLLRGSGGNYHHYLESYLSFLWILLENIQGEDELMNKAIVMDELLIQLLFQLLDNFIDEEYMGQLLVSMSASKLSKQQLIKKMSPGKDNAGYSNALLPVDTTNLDQMNNLKILHLYYSIIGKLFAFAKRITAVMIPAKLVEIVHNANKENTAEVISQSSKKARLEIHEPEASATIWQRYTPKFILYLLQQLSNANLKEIDSKRVESLQNYLESWCYCIVVILHQQPYLLMERPSSEVHADNIEDVLKWISVLRKHYQNCIESRLITENQRQVAGSLVLLLSQFLTMTMTLLQQFSLINSPNKQLIQPALEKELLEITKLTVRYFTVITIPGGMKLFQENIHLVNVTMQLLSGLLMHPLLQKSSSTFETVKGLLQVYENHPEITHSFGSLGSGSIALFLHVLKVRYNNQDLLQDVNNMPSSSTATIPWLESIKEIPANDYHYLLIKDVKQLVMAVPSAFPVNIAFALKWILHLNHQDMLGNYSSWTVSSEHDLLIWLTTISKIFQPSLDHATLLNHLKETIVNSSPLLDLKQQWFEEGGLLWLTVPVNTYNSSEIHHSFTAKKSTVPSAYTEHSLLPIVYLSIRCKITCMGILTTTLQANQYTETVHRQLQYSLICLSMLSQAATLLRLLVPRNDIVQNMLYECEYHLLEFIEAILKNLQNKLSAKHIKHTITYLKVMMTAIPKEFCPVDDPLIQFGHKECAARCKTFLTNIIGSCTKDDSALAMTQSFHAPSTVKTPAKRKSSSGGRVLFDEDDAFDDDDDGEFLTKSSSKKKPFKAVTTVLDEIDLMDDMDVGTTSTSAITSTSNADSTAMKSMEKADIYCLSKIIGWSIDGGCNRFLCTSIKKLQHEFLSDAKSFSAEIMLSVIERFISYHLYFAVIPLLEMKMKEIFNEWHYLGYCKILLIINELLRNPRYWEYLEILQQRQFHAFASSASIESLSSSEEEGKGIVASLMDQLDEEGKPKHLVYMMKLLFPADSLIVLEDYLFQYPQTRLIRLLCIKSIFNFVSNHTVSNTTPVNTNDNLATPVTTNVGSLLPTQILEDHKPQLRDLFTSTIVDTAISVRQLASTFLDKLFLLFLKPLKVYEHLSGVIVNHIQQQITTAIDELEEASQPKTLLVAINRSLRFELPLALSIAGKQLICMMHYFHPQNVILYRRCVNDLLQVYSPLLLDEEVNALLITDGTVDNSGSSSSPCTSDCNKLPYIYRELFRCSIMKAIEDTGYPDVQSYLIDHGCTFFQLWFDLYHAKVWNKQQKNGRLTTNKTVPKVISMSQFAHSQQEIDDNDTSNPQLNIFRLFPYEIVYTYFPTHKKMSAYPWMEHSFLYKSYLTSWQTELLQTISQVSDSQYRWYLLQTLLHELSYQVNDKEIASYMQTRITSLKAIEIYLYCQQLFLQTITKGIGQEISPAARTFSHISNTQSSGSSGDMSSVDPVPLLDASQIPLYESMIPVYTEKTQHIQTFITNTIHNKQYYSIAKLKEQVANILHAVYRMLFDLHSSSNQDIPVVGSFYQSIAWIEILYDQLIGLFKFPSAWDFIQAINILELLTFFEYSLAHSQWRHVLWYCIATIFVLLKMAGRELLGKPLIMQKLLRVLQQCASSFGSSVSHSDCLEEIISAHIYLMQVAKDFVETGTLTDESGLVISCIVSECAALNTWLSKCCLRTNPADENSHSSATHMQLEDFLTVYFGNQSSNKCPILTSHQRYQQSMLQDSLQCTIEGFLLSIYNTPKLVYHMKNDGNQLVMLPKSLLWTNAPILPMHFHNNLSYHLSTFVHYVNRILSGEDMLLAAWIQLLALEDVLAHLANMHSSQITTTHDNIRSTTFLSRAQQQQLLMQLLTLSKYISEHHTVYFQILQYCTTRIFSYLYHTDDIDLTIPYTNSLVISSSDMNTNYYSMLFDPIRCNQYNSQYYQVTIIKLVYSLLSTKDWYPIVSYMMKQLVNVQYFIKVGQLESYGILQKDVTLSTLCTAYITSGILTTSTNNQVWNDQEDTLFLLPSLLPLLSKAMVPIENEFVVHSLTSTAVTKSTTQQQFEQLLFHPVTMVWDEQLWKHAIPTPSGTSESMDSQAVSATYDEWIQRIAYCMGKLLLHQIRGWITSNSTGNSSTKGSNKTTSNPTNSAFTTVFQTYETFLLFLSKTISLSLLSTKYAEAIFPMIVMLLITFNGPNSLPYDKLSRRMLQYMLGNPSTGCYYIQATSLACVTLTFLLHENVSKFLKPDTITKTLSQDATTAAVGAMVTSNKRLHSQKENGGLGSSLSQTQANDIHAYAYNIGLNIDYLYIAKAAVRCQFYSTALVFVELAVDAYKHICHYGGQPLSAKTHSTSSPSSPWGSQLSPTPGNSSLLENDISIRQDEIRDLLITIYEGLNDVDALEGLDMSSNLYLQAVMYRHQGKWLEALSTYESILQSQTQDWFGSTTISTTTTNAASASNSISLAGESNSAMDFMKEKNSIYDGMSNALHNLGAIHTNNLFEKALPLHHSNTNAQKELSRWSFDPSSQPNDHLSLSVLKDLYFHHNEVSNPEALTSLQSIISDIQRDIFTSMVQTTTSEQKTALLSGISTQKEYQYLQIACNTSDSDENRTTAAFSSSSSSSSLQSNSSMVKSLQEQLIYSWLKSSQNNAQILHLCQFLMKQQIIPNNEILKMVNNIFDHIPDPRKAHAVSPHLYGLWNGIQQYTLHRSSSVSSLSSSGISSIVSTGQLVGIQIAMQECRLLWKKQSYEAALFKMNSIIIPALKTLYDTHCGGSVPSLKSTTATPLLRRASPIVDLSSPTEDTSSSSRNHGMKPPSILPTTTPNTMQFHMNSPEQIIPSLYTESLRLYGLWLSQKGSTSSKLIIEQYLDPSLEIATKYNDLIQSYLSPASTSSGNLSSTAANAVNAVNHTTSLLWRNTLVESCLALSNVTYTLYQHLQLRITSPEWLDNGKKLVERQEEYDVCVSLLKSPEYNPPTSTTNPTAIEKVNNDKRSLMRHIQLLKHDMEMDMKERGLILSSLETYLQLTVKYFVQILQLSSERNIDIMFRLIGLWFKNYLEYPIITKMIRDQVSALPSYKFVSLHYQILSRLGATLPSGISSSSGNNSVTNSMPNTPVSTPRTGASAATAIPLVPGTSSSNTLVVGNPMSMEILHTNHQQFQDALNYLVGKLCYEHPYHILPQLFALKFEQTVDSVYYKSNTSSRRSQCADMIIQELLNGTGPWIPITGAGKGGSSSSRAAAAGGAAAPSKQQQQQQQVITAEVQKIVYSTQILFQQYIELAKVSTEVYHKANHIKKIPFKDVTSGGKGCFHDCLNGLPIQPAVFTVTYPIQPIGRYTEITRTVSFSPTFDITENGISRPKIITCLGSNGKQYKQLVKNNDDMRQDLVMEQVFEYINYTLLKQDATYTRNLYIRTYKVTPTTPQTGILEWVENTQPLGGILCDPKTGLHIRYLKNNWSNIQCRKELSNAKTVKEKETCFANICQHFQPVFHYFFLEQFANPMEWMNNRMIYIRSMSTNSIAGYILGIGDRHAHNILIDSATGEVIHIDFGIVFEQGKALPIPETVPFRLTRELVDGMGITGYEGTYRKSCEEVLRVLRENTNNLLTILEVVIYDPLYKWSLSPIQAKLRQEIEISDFNMDKLTTTNTTAAVKRGSAAAVGSAVKNKKGVSVVVDDVAVVVGGHGAGAAATVGAIGGGSGGVGMMIGSNFNKDSAERTLMRIRNKLRGYEDPIGDALGIEGQVDWLINEAINPSNLCRIFPGWTPWL